MMKSSKNSKQNPESINETRPGRRRFLQGAAGGAIAAVLGGLPGCGSSGSGTGGGGVPGGGTDGTPVSPASRAAAQQAVNDKLDELMAAGPVDAQTMVDFLKTRSEFSRVGSVKPGGAWARFTDGQLLIVSFNLDPELGRSRDEYIPEFATRAPNAELPERNQARILNALGTAFSPPHNDIHTWLVKHGYDIAAGDASVNGLASVSGDGVFYINTHGNYGELEDGTTIWGMWTSDKVSDTQDTAFDSLLKSGALIRFSAPHNTNFFGLASSETHYAITARFLNEYNWQFGANSLIFMNCCWSADAVFQNECLNRGASAYGGWDNAAVPSGAWRCARFVFDRLLGQLKTGNQEYPETGGLQRSFDAQAIMADLHRRGWDFTSHPHFGTANFNLFAKSGGGDFGLLAPSIQQVDVSEYKGRLILKGKFGSDNPVNAHFVSVGGNDLTIIKWEKERIECELPLDAYGDVQVRVGIRKSNVRQLTRWDFDMTYLMKIPGTDLKITGKVPLRFRADIGKFRRTPGDALQNPERFAIVAKESDATLQASGVQSSGGCTNTWSKTITWKSNVYDGPTAYSIISRMRIDPTGKTGALGLGFGLLPPNKPYLQTAVCPMKTTLSDIAPTFGTLDGEVLFPDPLGTGTDISLFALNLIFDANFNIAEINHHALTGLLTLTAPPTPAKAPPDINAAKSAQIPGG
jgi:hypothetical protein